MEIDREKVKSLAMNLSYFLSEIAGVEALINNMRLELDERVRIIQTRQGNINKLLEELRGWLSA